ncbi:MAG: YHS domain protein, partial [Bacteroidota bacterium]
MLKISLSTLASVLTCLAIAQSGDLWYHNIDSNNVALGGYDLVSYFSEEGPLSGQENLSAEYNGITYLFSSRDNLNLFIGAPKNYL